MYLKAKTPRSRVDLRGTIDVREYIDIFGRTLERSKRFLLKNKKKKPEKKTAKPSRFSRGEMRRVRIVLRNRA